MKQHYVKRSSIVDVRHLGLDTYSNQSLLDAKEWIEENLFFPISQSIIGRRALRFYSEYLKSLKTDAKQQAEYFQIMLSAKGVV